MDFLGQVNVFRGRIEGGQAVVSGMHIDAPALVSGKSGAANVYVRPHELEIERYLNGGPSMTATVTRINPAGSLAKVVLATNEGSNIQVDLPFERYRELNLVEGEQVYVSPKHVRVFAPEYEI